MWRGNDDNGEDNFGRYSNKCVNPAHRCSMSDLSTTQTWLGTWTDMKHGMMSVCDIIKCENRILICVNKTGDFHSVQNVARSIFCDRILLKCVQWSSSNKICSTWLFVFQKKAIAKNWSHDICTKWKSTLMAIFCRISHSIESDWHSWIKNTIIEYFIIKWNN